MIAYKNVGNFLIDWQSLTLYSDENIWVAKGDFGIEVSIPNIEGKPEKNWLRFAQNALEDDILISRAIKMLNSWIKEEFKNGWRLDYVSFQGKFQKMHRNWEMAFTMDGDEYGLWVVTFCELGPSTFRRENR